MLFRTFGVVEVTAADEVLRFPAEKPRRLLSLLLLRANQWVPDSELIEVIWPTGSPVSAAGNLKSYVSQLRQQLTPHDSRTARIERQSGAYRIGVDRAELDTTLFEDLVDQGKAGLDRGAVYDAVARLTSALDLWRGQPFELLEVEVAKAEQARLTELRWSARRDLADAHLATGDANKAVALLRAMTAEDPLREQSWQRLMVALHRGGRRAEALSVYQDARKAIVAELGIEPGAELRGTYERLLRDDPPVSEPALGPTSTEAARPATEPEPVAELVSPARRRRPLLLVGSVLAVVVAVVAALVIVNRPSSGRATGDTAAERHSWGEPVNRAEFTTEVDGGWTVADRVPGRLERGRRMAERVDVRDGVMTITGTPNGDTGYLTRPGGFRYGRVEARLRVPAGAACYRPVLNLYPAAGSSGNEIVYLESFDADRQDANFFLESPRSKERLSASAEIDLTTWTNLAVEWTEGHVVGYLNGEEWFRADDRELVPSRAMRPVIKLEWVSEETGDASMAVDWIREYPVTR